MMRAVLRRLLDRIVEPRPTYQPRHGTGTPTSRRAEWWPYAWADATWADIAAKHQLHKRTDDDDV